jgi:hypothetical protein
VSTNREGPDSLVIDLDGGVVTYGDEVLPIKSVKGSFIEFGSYEEPTTHGFPGTRAGVIDRVTGGLSMTQHVLRENDAHEEISYDLTCRRANPVF